MSSSEAGPASLGALLRPRWRAIALGLGVGLLALAAALWGVDLREVARALTHASPGWLLAVAGVFLVQQGLRALRQWVLLRAVAPTHSFRTSLSVLCISFFFINALPVRLGEAVRPLLLYERERIPVGAGVAAIFLERVVDLLSVFVMLGLVVFLVDVPMARVHLGDTEVDLLAVGRGMALTALPLVLLGTGVVVALGPRLLHLARPLAQRPGLPGRLAAMVLSFGQSFVEGLAAVRSPTRVAAVLGLTALTWGLTAAMYPLMARAFGVEEAVGYGAGLTLLAVTMLAMAVPSAPGFAGTYEAALRGGLALFGVAGSALAPESGLSLDAVAVAFALTFHWWVNGVQALTALFFLAVDGISVRRLMGDLARAAAPGDAPPGDEAGAPGA